MNNILTMLRHEFKSKFGVGRKSSPKRWGVFFLNTIASILMYAIFLTIIFFISNMILTGRIEMNYEFLVLSTALSMIIQIITSSGSLVKSLYFDADNELLLRFPVDGGEIFVAKSAFVFIKNIFVSLMLTLPFYIFYGITFNLGAGFYVSSTMVAVYISILPFYVANLVSTPVMYVVNSVKNKFALILIILIAMIVIGFSVYMLLLKGVLEYMQTQQSAIFSQEVLQTFKLWAGRLVPF